MTEKHNQERTFEFTDRALKGLPIPPKPQQLDYFDGKVRGLGIRISYGGRRTFFVMYSNERKKRQRLSLGEYGRLEDGKLSLAEARKQGRVKLGAVAQDRDPAADARAHRQSPTATVLAADFITMQRKAKKKSADRQERLLALNVLPEIGDMKARDVKRDDVKRIMSKITDRGAAVLANRVHEIIRSMFNFGIEEEVYGLESNPGDHLRRHRNPEQGRERWLSLDELRRYWMGLEDTADGPADALRLCLLTAQRQSNVLGMRRDQLALGDHLWICPASTTKTNQTYRVPLSSAAVGIIEGRIATLEKDERRRANRNRCDPLPVEWIFPAAAGETAAGLTFTGNPHRALCKRVKIKGYRVHDHRRSFGTHCEQMGISRLIWDAILGHSSNGMADLYSGHDFAQERLDCMERWADRIAAAVADNVVNIEDRRA